MAYSPRDMNRSAIGLRVHGRPGAAQNGQKISCLMCCRIGKAVWNFVFFDSATHTAGNFLSVLGRARQTMHTQADSGSVRISR